MGGLAGSSDSCLASCDLSAWFSFAFAVVFPGGGEADVEDPLIPASVVLLELKFLERTPRRLAGGWNRKRTEFGFGGRVCFLITKTSEDKGGTQQGRQRAGRTDDTLPTRVTGSAEYLLIRWLKSAESLVLNETTESRLLRRVHSRCSSLCLVG